MVGLACHVPCTTATDADARLRFVRTLCTDKLFVQSHGAKAPKFVPQLSVRVCTDILYGHCGGATRRRNALGKPSFGFPRPFPRLETTQKKFQGFELSLITASAVPRSFALRLSVTIGREGWALCVYLNFVVHFIYSVSVI